MSDLIRRQDAIDYIKTQRGRPFIGITLEEAIIMMIEEVPSAEKAQLSEEAATFDIPSAEPKTPSNGSITCMKSEKMHDRTTDGLIRRQEAKDAIDMALDHIDHVPPWVYDKLLNVLNEVPSAEKAQLSGEDATSVCKCPCVYREPCDYCHYDAYRGHGCPAEEGLKDE